MSKYPNVIKCLQCKMILVSFDRHDYKTCSCPNRTMIDGGHDYLRYGGKDLTKIQVLKIIKMPGWKKGKYNAKIRR